VQADMTKLIVCFHNFANTPRKDSFRVTHLQFFGVTILFFLILQTATLLQIKCYEDI
jgi:hypothetical protein